MTAAGLATAIGTGAVFSGVLAALVVVKLDGLRRRHAARRRAARRKGYVEVR